MGDSPAKAEEGSAFQRHRKDFLVGTGVSSLLSPYSSLHWVLGHYFVRFSEEGDWLLEICWSLRRMSTFLNVLVPG